MEEITSRENGNIKEYIKLAKQKAYRDTAGIFALESRKLVREAVMCGVLFEKVFVTPDALHTADTVLQKLFDCTRTILIPAQVEQKMTQTKNAGGIFAVCRKRSHPKVGTGLPPGRYLALSGLQDTGNVGTILRTADAFGLHGVVFSGNTCDLYHPKVLRAAMGAAFRIPVYYGLDTPNEVSKLSGQFATYAAVPDQTAEPVPGTAFPGQCIILIGNEGSGLPVAMQDACSSRITLRMQGNAESLNAGMAAGILIWELTK